MLDEPIAKVERNVAGLRTLYAGGARDLADAFIAHLRREPVPERFKFAIEQASAERCDLRVAWYDDNYRRLTIERSRSPEFDFVITGLPFMVAEWIRDDAIGEAVFFEDADWKSTRSRGTRVPW